MRRLLAVLLVAGMVCAQAALKFMGRTVTITEPGVDESGWPKGPAKICLEGQQRQCYAAPKEFGLVPAATVLQLDKETPAIFFSAASGGGSGFRVHFALLRPETGKDMEKLLTLDVSNQSEHSFWADSSISDAVIFATADYVWGPGEAHYQDHRHIISAYVRKADTDGWRGYYLEDRYMTTRKYGGENPKILEAEKLEILARLKRVKESRR
jgi:hypothetical protein